MRYRVFLLALAILAAGFGAVPLRADSGEYVRAQVSRDTVNIGDSLVYTVEVNVSGSRPASPDITPPDLSGSFQVQDVFTRSSVSILNGKTHVITFKEVHLVANHTGRITLPPSRVEFGASATEPRPPQMSNPVTLTVNEASGAAALPTPTAEIEVLRPIKRAAHLSPSQWLPFAVAVVFLLFALSVVAYIKRRPEPGPEAEPAPVDPRTAEQRALESLAEAVRLKQAGKIKDYYTRLSACLRRFLAEEYRFPGEELTTGELLREMRRLEFAGDFLARFHAYMLECDQVKFANALPAAAAVESAGERARELILAADKRPRSVAPAAAQEPVSARAAGKEARTS